MTEAQEQTDVETDGVAYEKQHAKVLRFEISVGKDDDDRTIEDFEKAIRDALDNGVVNAHNVTYQGGYYIIDGKVCLTKDYDHAIKNRKPGTYPPQWAGGPDPKTLEKASADPWSAAEEKVREFVRVKPTINTQRDPLTGRRVRKDKGVPRGPRKAPGDKLDIKAAVAKLGDQMKESKS
jgi:hypothetical protein